MPTSAALRSWAIGWHSEEHPATHRTAYFAKKKSSGVKKLDFISAMINPLILQYRPLPIFFWDSLSMPH
jgi:hypothetical protein